MIDFQYNALCKCSNLIPTSDRSRAKARSSMASSISRYGSYLSFANVPNAALATLHAYLMAIIDLRWNISDFSWQYGKYDDSWFAIVKVIAARGAMVPINAIGERNQRIFTNGCCELSILLTTTPTYVNHSLNHVKKSVNMKNASTHVSV